jgi:hypothetical protein
VYALLRFSGSVAHDPAVSARFAARPGELGSLAHEWFVRLRNCGEHVQELFHDGSPVLCVQDAPFGYVNAFRAHVSVRFFHGASLPDPAHLLEGSGKYMRHVNLRPNQPYNKAALEALVFAAYIDIRARLESAA